MRPIRIYDTLSRSVRPFTPLNPPRVGMFVCGLTPYSEAHLGHARTFVTFDVVARALRRWGYRVFYVQNVTNLDDKIIDRARETGRDPLEVAESHFQGWLRAMELLDIRSVNYYPFATDYVPEIIAQASELMRRGFVYEAQGDLYFEVAKFPDYGKLSGQKVEALRPGARVDVDPKKRAPEDFAVWKSAKPGEPSWPSPWGPGRPGWHIEDTAMTGRLLGEQYDLHGAGIDLIFPHHEAEIALAESTWGRKPFVRCWMHGGLLTMREEKMAKSVGNVVGLDASLRAFGGDTLRFYFLSANYRSPLAFEPGKSLEEARAAADTLVAPYVRIREELHRDGLNRAGRDLPPDLAKQATELPERLDATLSEDFQTREALALLFGWSRGLNDWVPKLDRLSGSSLITLGAPYRWAAEVLGLFPERTSASLPIELSGLVELTLRARTRARNRGDYAEADRIRDELRTSGVELEDEGTATRWTWKRAAPR